ncbi:MAG: hypothetical protein J7K73_01790 [Nanoarchaeota archaeon]|nr:hypothetical protein [Nanoarchaeota archaeon]
MNFKEICKKIDKNPSTKIHNYYQKILALLFLEGQDPFNRKLIDIEAEKKIGKGVADLFLKWEYKGMTFTEIIEVHLKPRKKILEDKIKLYNGKANLLSICIPSNQLEAIHAVFKKMKKDLTKINIVYLIDSDVVSKNKRKIVKDKNMIVGLHSPFYLTKKKDFELIKEDVNSKRYLLFEAFLPIYLKK